MLSVLMVTRGQPYAEPFIRSAVALAQGADGECVLVADGDDAARFVLGLDAGGMVVKVESKGYVESVLDEALTYCLGDYVLRLDDDEQVSPAMESWVEQGEYLAADHWKFPRMHLWPDPYTMIVSPHLWPDEQTRLSTRAKAGGRKTIHAPSPYGGGMLAPVAIEHHKFLVCSRTEREETARRWHGDSMTAFSLPEVAYERVRCVDAGMGHVPWTPRWDHVYDMRTGEVVR